ncbi:hypothetical protein Dsin_012154 [Dipteronia sinensis]|uniref:Retrotransposon gag domain-containing protein n=1 Tax=Dipteronia sinensis TaxID=43782 RepID=A0AAE0E7X1_9ROSI|nr:hypothetical protein Dsin_012154 [Dipteronia sinensis]
MQILLYKLIWIHSNTINSIPNLTVYIVPELCIELVMDMRRVKQHKDQIVDLVCSWVDGFSHPNPPVFSGQGRSPAIPDPLTFIWIDLFLRLSHQNSSLLRRRGRSPVFHRDLVQIEPRSAAGSLDQFGLRPSAFVASIRACGSSTGCSSVRGCLLIYWRTRLADDLSAGRPKIDTWEVLKKELKDQFLPCNTSWLARESLKKLKQTDSMREYVKGFSSLMLDIQNMSEEDKLFNFMSGLQKWAHAELRRQRVKDIPTAMAAAEGLVDFHLGGSTSSSADKGKSVERTKRRTGRRKLMERKKRKKRLRPQRGRTILIANIRAVLFAMVHIVQEIVP